MGSEVSVGRVPGQHFAPRITRFLKIHHNFCPEGPGMEMGFLGECVGFRVKG